MSVFREFSVKWNGEEYSIVPSMGLLQRIEGYGDGISLMFLSHMLSSGKPPHGQMSMVIGVVLRSAGADVSDENILQEFIYGDAKAAVDVYSQIIDALSPERKGDDTKKKTKPSKPEE